MKILIADDEEILAEALATILTHNHYSVETVFNGQDAYDYLSSGDYDGAILDVMMPGMDGITVLKKIRSEGSSIPVLLLTARSEVEDRVEGLDAGADDYLPKPFDSRELLARIRSMLRRQPEVAMNDLTFGDLSLSCTSFHIRGPEGEERLVNKEFQMLELLMRNPTRTFSADQFLEKIWGYETDSDVNAVWVALSGLRKKLTATGAHIRIKATRGIGYSLEETK